MAIGAVVSATAVLMLAHTQSAAQGTLPEIVVMAPKKKAKPDTRRPQGD